jgi:hypothetical protein
VNAWNVYCQRVQECARETPVRIALRLHRANCHRAGCDSVLDILNCAVDALCLNGHCTDVSTPECR